MRWIIFTVVCVSSLAAGPRRTEPERFSELRSRPQATAKGKRAFHPFRFLRRLGQVESDLALRLSSLGIRQEAEAGPSPGLLRPIPGAETSTLRIQDPLGGASQ